MTSGSSETLDGRSSVPPPSGVHRVRRVVVWVLWAAALSAATIRVAGLLADPTLPGESWQKLHANLVDFRDIIWVPGRHLLAGGNPYDPGPYLAAHPWAQEFDPYAPAWLLLAIVIAPLPFLVAATVYQALTTIVAVVLLRVLSRWVFPRAVDIAVPAGLLWLNLWYPGRGSMEGGASIIAVLGVALVLRSLCGADPATRLGSAGCSIGIALSLIKPQFGLPFTLFALIDRRWKDVLRGVALLFVASLPAIILCSVAAGGFAEFIQSILRDLAFANSPSAPTGLGSPYQLRVDVVGLVARYGWVDQPGWFEACVTGVALAAGVFAVCRTREPLALCATTSAACLLGFVHFPYDVVLIFLPFFVGLGTVITARRRPTPIEGLTILLSALVVAHVHRISMFLVPGLTPLGADTADSIMVALLLVLGLVGAWIAPRDRGLARKDALDAV